MFFGLDSHIAALGFLHVINDEPSRGAGLVLPHRFENIFFIGFIVVLMRPATIINLLCLANLFSSPLFFIPLVTQVVHLYFFPLLPGLLPLKILFLLLDDLFPDTDQDII